MLLIFLMVATVHAWDFSSLFGKTRHDSSDVILTFFDEKIAENGFEYAYPAASSVTVVQGTAKNGKAAVSIILDPGDYSGGSICRNGQFKDLRPFLKTAALRFWVRGASGGEKAWIALVDNEKNDGHKTVVRLPVDWFGGIKTDWTLISIPLENFGEQGLYWDAKELREVDNPFDWNQVVEFRVESRKGENQSFDVQVDDICIVKLIR